MKLLFLCGAVVAIGALAGALILRSRDGSAQPEPITMQRDPCWAQGTLTARVRQMVKDFPEVFPGVDSTGVSAVFSSGDEYLRDQVLGYRLRVPAAERRDRGDRTPRNPHFAWTDDAGTIHVIGRDLDAIGGETCGPVLEGILAHELGHLVVQGLGGTRTVAVAGDLRQALVEGFSDHLMRRYLDGKWGKARADEVMMSLAAAASNVSGQSDRRLVSAFFASIEKDLGHRRTVQSVFGDASDINVRDLLDPTRFINRVRAHRDAPAAPPVRVPVSGAAVWLPLQSVSDAAGGSPGHVIGVRHDCEPLRRLAMADRVELYFLRSSDGSITAAHNALHRNVIGHGRLTIPGDFASETYQVCWTIGRSGDTAGVTLSGGAWLDQEYVEFLLGHTGSHAVLVVMRGTTACTETLTGLIWDVVEDTLRDGKGEARQDADPPLSCTLCDSDKTADPGAAVAALRSGDAHTVVTAFASLACDQTVQGREHDVAEVAISAHEPFRVQACLALLMGTRSGEETERVLRHVASAGDPGACVAAARAASILTHPRAVEILRDLRAHDASGVRSEAVSGLLRLAQQRAGPPNVGPPEALAADPDPRIRIRYLEIVKSGVLDSDPSVAAHVSKLLSDPSPAIRYRAWDCALAIGAPLSSDTLAVGVEDPIDYVRDAALLCLGAGYGVAGPLRSAESRISPQDLMERALGVTERAGRADLFSLVVAACETHKVHSPGIHAAYERAASDPQLLPRLLQNIDSASDEARQVLTQAVRKAFEVRVAEESACRAAGKLRLTDDWAVSRMSDSLRSASPNVRFEAAIALATIDRLPPAAWRVVADAALFGTTPQLMDAVELLARSDDERARRYLANELPRRPELLRRFIVESTAPGSKDSGR